MEGGLEGEVERLVGREVVGEGSWEWDGVLEGGKFGMVVGGGRVLGWVKSGSSVVVEGALTPGFGRFGFWLSLVSVALAGSWAVGVESSGQRMLAGVSPIGLGEELLDADEEDESVMMPRLAEPVKALVFK